MSKNTVSSNIKTSRFAIQYPRFSKPVFVYCLLPIAYCLLTLSLNSCKDKKDNLTIDYQYAYYPLDSAHYVVYDVDSIFYSYNGVYTRDTVHYQWKVVIADTSYRLEIFRRPDSNGIWSIDRVWSATRTTTNLQVSEDDIKFVKLVFPPQAGESWNGNEYIPTTGPYIIFQNWNYYYANTDTAFSINGLDFSHALVVSEVNNENLISKTLRREIYAKNVGMIYQEWESLSKQNVLADWNTGPENGFRIRMRIRDHN